jgi:hypothetical protein
VFVLPQHERYVGFRTSHVYNLMLQILLTTRWVGVALFTIQVLGVGLRAVVLGDRVTIALLSFARLNGVTESSGFTTLANICALFFVIAVTRQAMLHGYEDDYSYLQGFS